MAIPDVGVYVSLLLWAVVSAGLVWRLMRGLRRADASPPNC
jgi:hypothetical protein